jgi:hypothetical protein
VQIRQDKGETETANYHKNKNRMVHQWKEWAYATDPHGQHYYMEQWNRMPSLRSLAQQQHDKKVNSYILALRKVADKDGVLILVDGYFSYIQGHQFPDPIDDDDTTTTVGQDGNNNKSQITNLVDLVDIALASGNREVALTYLQRMEAGHGCIVNKPDPDGKTDRSPPIRQWMIHRAIPPWKQGSVLFEPGDISVKAGSISTLSDCRVFWNNDEWEIYDLCGFETLQQLQELFGEKKAYDNLKSKY